MPGSQLQGQSAATRPLLTLPGSRYEERFVPMTPARVVDQARGPHAPRIRTSPGPPLPQPGGLWHDRLHCSQPLVRIRRLSLHEKGA